MGIIAGMEVSSSYDDTSAKICISPGCGITSEGYVISFPSIINLTHYQNDTTVASQLFALSEDASSATPSQYQVIELFQEKADKAVSLYQNSGENQRNPQTVADFISDRVLVVVCETQDTQSDFCLLEYDELSKYRNFRWRFFLIPRVPQAENPLRISAETLLTKTYQILEQPWKGFPPEVIFAARNHFLQEFDQEAKKFQDFAPQVQRFGYVEAKNSVDLTEIKDYQSFRDNYYQICKNAIAVIGKSFPKLFWLFSPFLTTFQRNLLEDFKQLQENLEKRLEDFKQLRKNEATVSSEKVEPPEPIYALQYFYDYLSQLVAAYNELAETAFDLMDDYPPETRRFPKFLMLGLVPSKSPVATEPNQEYTLTSPYRSHFTQPPIYNSNQVRAQQVRYLYERLLKLSAKESFSLLPFYDTPVKITPSQDRSAPLSKQAIPYYLDYFNLYKYWNYDAYRKGRSDRHPAYFRPQQESAANSLVFNDLIYRLDASNFYRIEGHIGKANDDAFKRIQDYKQRYSLAFDVITLKLGSQASLQDLNITGQFDDLEADFRHIQTAFQKLWNQSSNVLSSNVFLQTLKQHFFDKPGLTAIDDSQLSNDNDILDIARKAEAYEFIQDDTDQKFKLYVREVNNTNISPIARYVTQVPNTEGNSLNDFNDLIIDFSGLASDVIEQEKQRIINEIVDRLSLREVTCDLVIDASSNTAKYHLQLSRKDIVNLPSPLLQYSPVLLSLNHFPASFSGDEELTEQQEFPDFETLYSLLRELKRLIKVYRQRLEKLMKLHLFPKFAQQHPGMEHLGGVPKGGTFVLVYVDGKEVDELLAADKEPAIHKLRSLRMEEIQKSVALPPDLYQEKTSNWEKLFNELRNRKDIVVADFCLPYRCSSDAPAVNYILARSRPIILLEKTVFCEDDDRKYEFTLEPEGGTVRGKGVVFEGSKQLFQPSSIDQASRDDLAKGLEVAITFAYAVDETYDTLTITVYPLPRPNLSVSNGQKFCHNSAPVEINLADGTPENIELVQVNINGTETKTLNPNQYATGSEPETVTITALIRNLQTKCENTLTPTVVINPLPKAELSIFEGENFCHNAEPVEIKLADGTPENIELVQVNINGTETKTLNPNQYATGSEPKTVTITALIRDRQTKCENTLTRTVTINPLPKAELSILEGQNFCHNAEPVEIKLADGTSENIELVQVNINGTETKTLNPSQYATGSEPETVTITALIRNQQTQCENTLTRTVTINPLPQADFQAEITNISDSGFSVRVFDIQPAEETFFTFDWEHDGIPNVSNPGNIEFIISYNYDPDTWNADAEKSITLRVQTPPELGSCTSEPVTKTIPIPLRGVQGFNLLTISNNEIINTTTLERDRTFNVSDFNPNNEYAIACVTIPATVGSVIFTYTAPNADAENLQAIAPPYLLIWQPTVGIHQITAQASREINSDRLEGTASTVTIQINDDNNGEPELIPNEPEPKSFTLPNRLRVLFEPSDQDISEFKLINHEDTIKPSQVLVLEQPHLEKWRQRETTRDKNLIFSALTRQSQLGKLLVISAASLLLIAGWTYSIARQSQNQQNSQPSSNLRF
ncbi:hypothetical protein CK510_09945 [Brunnivagina elsteri CCALA 953]|uniref:Uncharacterized protein n=2 Tax=Brunnivagina TaxID=3344733 RepID=A0A2A2TKD5_9CYAN|nr:hypothetical protein CK510_09945 [Calothrix elsteri CCALA 953]